MMSKRVNTGACIIDRTAASTYMKVADPELLPQGVQLIWLRHGFNLHPQQHTSDQGNVG
jgi:hypothetical protein